MTGVRATPLNIDVLQAPALLGDLEAQVNVVLAERAHSSADLLITPECYLTGYPLQDLVLRPGFMAQVTAALNRLAHEVATTPGPAVLIGAPHGGSDLPYNAAHLLCTDGTRSVAFKTELPNNDVFDERRVFAQGSSPTPLAFNGWNLGVMVCEDMWHGPVARRLADEGADLLIVLNGSPMEHQKQPVRLAHARRRVAATGLPLLYVNLIGGQDELVFDGASFALDRQGEVLAQVPFEEGVLSLTVVPEPSGAPTLVGGAWRALVGAPAPHDRSPLQAYPDDDEAIYRTLVRGLADYTNANGFTEVVIGLSGGLDSAIVAALAVDALGSDRVRCLMMPAQWTGAESQSLAAEQAQRLGCAYATVPVGDLVAAGEQALNALTSAWPVLDQPRGRALASENLQARSRGQLLMAWSNARPGTLVLSTGNKSEMSVGYATLYGDMCGGFNPIKDLYKTTVQRLVAWRNAHALPWMLGPVEPVLEAIAQRAPSAELAPGQSDEAALGAYPVLDAVLEGLIEHLLGPEASARQAQRRLGVEVDVAYARRIARLVRQAEYKRRQAPPGIKITARSFGFGWRYPITNRADLA